MATETTSGRLSAGDVVTALRRRYGCESDNIGPEWSALDEMAMGPTSTPPIIDLLCIRAWRGKPKGHERHAIEVKVSRGDLRREVESGKWRPWAEVVHRFYLAVPASLNLDGLEIPDEWGIITVTAKGTSEQRKAPRRDPDPLPEPVLVEAVRRASRAEARIRDGQADDDPAATIARLERQAASAAQSVATAREAERRWKARAETALRLYADVAPDVHCRCGARVKIAKRPFRAGYHGIEWQHDGEPGLDPFALRRDRRESCRYAGPDLDRLAEALAETA